MLIPALIFLVSFGWFAYHAVPSVYFGDNGELLTAILTGGVPHPTGFPLFLLLSTLPGRLGTFPVNLASSAAGALSLTLTYALARKTFGQASALAATLVLAGSTTLTLHSDMARVYPYQLALLAAVLIAASSFQPDKRWALGFGFVLGLSAGTHMLFLGGALFAIVLLWGRREEIRPIGTWILPGLALGLSLYLWIPLRDHPVANEAWGKPDHFGALWGYLSQKPYDQKKFSRGLMGSWLFLKVLAGAWSREWNPLAWVLALAGAASAWRVHRTKLWALLAVVLFNFALLYAYGNETDLPILYRYFLPTYLASALLAGKGFDPLWRRWGPALKISRVTALVLLGALMLSVPAWKWSDLNRSESCWGEILDLLKPLPRKSTVLIAGDNQVFPLAYAVLAQGLRPDLRVVEWETTVFPEGKKALAAARPGARRSDLEKKWYDEGGGELFLPDERIVSGDFHIRPWGQVYRMSDRASEQRLPPPPKPLGLDRDPTWAEKRDPEAQESISDIHLMAAAWDLHRDDGPSARLELQRALALGPDCLHTLINASAYYGRMEGEDDASLACLNHALETHPDDFTPYLNLGVQYGKMHRYRECAYFLHQADRLQPGNPVVRGYLDLLAKATQTQP